MNKIIKDFMLLCLPLLIINCGGDSSKTKSSNTSNSNSVINSYSYTSISGEPNEDWVGKFLKIQFDGMGGRSIAGKTKIVQILDYDKDDEGYKFFSVKDLSGGYLQEVFFFWFGNYGGKNGFGPNIQEWKEAIPK